MFKLRRDEAEGAVCVVAVDAPAEDDAAVAAPRGDERVSTIGARVDARSGTREATCGNLASETGEGALEE
jgi:hypothetical protein